MSQKIKNLIFTVMVSLSLGVPALVPAVVSADTTSPNPIVSAACTGSNDIGNAASPPTGKDATCGSETGTSGLSKIASQLVNVFSIIVGIAAVVMIIFGGFKYITSGGDSNNVSGAKNTLIYAIIGLIVVALAQFIVHYVLNTASNFGN